MGGGKLQKFLEMVVVALDVNDTHTEAGEEEGDEWRGFGRMVGDASWSGTEPSTSEAVSEATEEWGGFRALSVSGGGS